MFSQDFVYKPKNPAFGGDTFNYQWLLSSAQAQDTYEDPSKKESSYNRDPIQDFEDNINRQILYQLSRRLITDNLGEESLDEGSYKIGSYQIDIKEGAGGVSVKIVDDATGSQTEVLIPEI